MAKKILIVEDDSFLQGLAATKLTKEGYAVSVASNTADAEKAGLADTPDFILLDLVLPGTSGFEVLKTFRANPKLATTPIIIFSNLAEDKDIMQAKELGATDFMIKSNFTLDELADKIKSLIGQ
jgi:DNA-binding response OmpR family regulator